MIPHRVVVPVSIDRPGLPAHKDLIVPERGLMRKAEISLDLTESNREQLSGHNTTWNETEMTRNGVINVYWVCRGTRSVDSEREWRGFECFTCEIASVIGRT